MREAVMGMDDYGRVHGSVGSTDLGTRSEVVFPKCPGGCEMAGFQDRNDSLELDAVVNWAMEETGRVLRADVDREKRVLAESCSVLNQRLLEIMISSSLPDSLNNRPAFCRALCELWLGFSGTRPR